MRPQSPRKKAKGNKVQEKPPPDQQADRKNTKQKANTAQEQTWAGVATTLQVTNSKIDQIQAQQARIIQELREQVAQQNLEIARLKQQLLAAQAKERRQEQLPTLPVITQSALQDPTDYGSICSKCKKPS